MGCDVFASQLVFPFDVDREGWQLKSGCVNQD
jgi:hypothetical protein